VSDIGLGLMALNFVWLVGLTLLTAARKPGDEAQRGVADARERLERLEARVHVLETHIEHLPTGAEVADMKGASREMRAMLIALQESLSGLRQTVNLIDEHLRRISAK
jgi:archaellum component FlaC